MNRSMDLSNGEWKLMNALWEKAPRSVSELVRDLAGETGWSKSTIHIMLSRMADKGAVRSDGSGGIIRYYPVLQREDTALRETKNFLSKVYGGSVGSMMACMAGQSELTQADIDALYEILRKAEREAGK